MYKYRAVPTLNDFPYASRDREWDADAADSRIRSYITNSDQEGFEDWSDEQWSEYRDYHLWYDSEDPQNLGSYKLRFCDIIDGSPNKIPRAIFTVAAVLEGSMGGVDIPADDKELVRARVKTMYEEMAEKFDDEDIVVPWEEENTKNIYKRSDMKPEIRNFQSDFEVKQEGEEGNKKIAGYAAVFDQEAPETMGFIEKIEKGAFTEALKDSDVRALFNHNQDKILGREKSGTLEIKEDETGLYYEIDPADTTYAKDLLISMERGDVDESSFAFEVAEESWDESGEIPIRTIEKVMSLYDVSPVTRGWYPQTDSGIKSKNEVLREFRNRQKQQQGERDKDSLDLYRRKVNINERKVL